MQMKLGAACEHGPCTPDCRQLLCFSSSTGLPVNETLCSKIESPGVAEVACSPSQLPASCKASLPPPLEQLNITVACPEGSALDINGHCCSGGWALKCAGAAASPGVVALSVWLLLDLQPGCRGRLQQAPAQV